MASNVNNLFRIQNAVGIAVLAIIADCYFNQGQIIRTVASGIFGNIVKLFNGAPDNSIQNNTGKYRVVPHQFNNFENEDEALKRALERVHKNFPEEYQKVLLKNGLSSEEEIFRYFKGSLSKGLCCGVANALFDKIHRKESCSLKESVPLLNFEDIFYHQILQELCVKRATLDIFTEIQLLREQMKFKDKSGALKLTENFSLNPTSTEVETKSDDEWAEIKKQIRAQLEKDLVHVGKDYHSNTFPQSEKFPVSADIPVYQKSLKEMIDQFPDQDNFVGCLQIQNHEIGFQYGKNGYYLYDPFDADKGLFEYPDSETFFQELTSHAVEDVMYIKANLILQKSPNISTRQLKDDADELVKKVKAHFGVRPLNNINS